MKDIRETLFEEIMEKKFRVTLTAEKSGVISGVEEALKCAEELGIDLEICKAEGEEVNHGQVFANFIGTPMQVALAEEKLIGTISKFSGIATASKNAHIMADGKIEIISGSWKKMPSEIKNGVRLATKSGGCQFRICEPPMTYLDKNFIRMFGSMKATLEAVKKLPKATTIIQIRGFEGSISEETALAVSGGADILMVDTGKVEDAIECISYLKKEGLRYRVKVAFAGNVKITDIPKYAEIGIDKLCIGKEIVDAQLLDIKLDVVGEEL